MADARPDRLLVGAGVVSWGVAGAPAVAAWLGGAAFGARGLAWCAAFVAFGAAFVLAAWTDRLSARGRTISLAAQSIAALVAVFVDASGFEAVLLCVVAGEAPFFVSARAALAWIGAQSAAMLALLAWRWHDPRQALARAGVFAGFQLFAYAASLFAEREARARRELARVHAELLATRELYADSTRTAERLRIARELHDALGHHLTALVLQLELAKNVSHDEAAREPVERAHAVGKELLGELRDVVSAMREDRPIDLAHALRTLVAGIPRPRVHLALPEEELRLDAAVAHAVFRCVQEALTNALRHAGADNVWLAVEREDGAVKVTARDDGRGADVVENGHGLAGLRERVEELGGRVDIDAARGRGVTLRALLPVRGGAS